MKKLLSLLLCLAIVFSSTPVGVVAEDTQSEEPSAFSLSENQGESVEEEITGEKNQEEVVEEESQKEADKEDIIPEEVVKQDIADSTPEEEELNQEEQVEKLTEIVEEVVEETAEEIIEKPIAEDTVQFNQNDENDKIEIENDKIEEENEQIEEAFQLVESQVIDNIKITVNGTFAEEGTLSIKKVESQELSENNITESHSFDIKVLNSDSQEIQPIDKIHVSFEFESISENVDIEVYHEEEQLEAETKENVVIVESNGFSIYTVEFTYEDKEYALDGDSYIKLYDLLSLIELNGEVESWEVSNLLLFNIYLGTEDEVSYDYEIIDENIYEYPVNNPDGDTLYVVPLQMFNTEEWLKVVIEGIEYEIKVTDDNIYQNVPSSYTGNISTHNDDNLAITGDTYFLNAPKPDYVMQSQSTTSATDFAAGLPLSTIFIDVDKIGNANNVGVQGEFTLLTENEAIRNGFEHYYTTDGSGNNMQLTGDVVIYNPLADTENLMQIEPNKINVLEGDLFQFIYRDAAILPNGSRAHVKIVYSNAKIAVDQRLGVTDTASGLTASNYQGAIYLARGGTVARGGNDERYLGWRSRTLAQEPNQPFTQAQKQAMVNAVDNTINTNWGQSYITNNANSTETPALGQSIDVKYQVVDDDGHPVDGTFIFAVTGINLDRDPYAVSGNNTAKPLWTYTKDDSDTHFFSEAMSINQGKVSDYIYVRPNTNVFESNELKQQAEASNPPSQKLSYYYAQVIEDANGHVKFIGNGYNPSNLGGNDKSYNAGFVVLANAKDGITVTSTGHATSRLGMNTQAWGGVQIWYRYISWTGPGGNIQTTSEGNYGGTLNDSSDQGVNSNILDAGVYVVPEGKDVTYTMAPNEGYQIKSLKVKSASGSLREIKFNGKALSTMTEGQTYSFNDAAGRRCTLTALADGKFKLVIPYAKHDEEVRVEWERTNAEVKVKKSTVNDLPGTFNFKIKAQKKEDVTSYTPELLGSVWKDPETQEYKTDIENMTIDFEEFIARLNSTMYVNRLTIDDAEYSWGKTIWKTDTNLSDLGFDIDDDLFVGFANIASSIADETVDIALNTGYSAAGPERIYLFKPNTTLTKDVITYWNFSTSKGQRTDPGWYNFTVDAGDEKTLTVQRGYTYEVQEVNDANWELLDIDGNSIQSATGILNDSINNPEHEFLNREVPDLTIKKETVNNVPGTFEFKIRAWTEEEQETVDEIEIFNGVLENHYGGSFAGGEIFRANDSTRLNPDTDKIIKDLYFSDITRDGTFTVDGREFRIENIEVFHEGTTPHEEMHGLYYSRIEFKSDIILWGDGTDYYSRAFRGEVYAYSGEQNSTSPARGSFIASGMGDHNYANWPYEVSDWNNKTVSIKVNVKTTSQYEKYLDLSEQFGEPDSDGYYHFTLANAESLNIPNLPYGSKYEVIEVEQDGWRLTDKENDKGEITDNTTATFTNEKLFSLTIRKETDVDTDEDFDFEIRIIQPEETLDFPYNEWTKVYQDSGEGGNQGWESDIPGSVAKEFIEKYYPTNRLYIETLEQTHLTGGVPDGYYYSNGFGKISDVTENGFFADAGADNGSYFEYSPYLSTTGYGNFFMNNSMATGHTSDRHLVFYLRERYIDLSGYGTAVTDEHNNYYQHDVHGHDNPDGISDNGFYRFKLKSGESLTIPNIPYGYQYEVYEVDKDGNRVAIGDVFNTKWELKSKTNDSGTLTENTTSVFTNEIKRGSINIRKETKGNEEGEFKFKAKVWNEYTSTTDTLEFTITGEEDIPEVASGYSNRITSLTLTIDEIYEKLSALSTQRKYISINEDVFEFNRFVKNINSWDANIVLRYGLRAIAAFDSFNQREGIIFSAPQSVLLAQGDVVKIYGKSNVTNYLDLTSYGGTVTTEEGVYEFTLQNGESFNIDEIPFGYKYEVYEETPDGWELISIDGLAPREKAEGTISSEAPYEHTFLNAKKKTLTFSKEVTGNMGDKRKEFEFEVIIYGEKLLFSDEVGEYLPANSYFGGVAGILFKRQELNQSLFEAHFNKFESGNLSDLKGYVEQDTYCRFDTGLIYESPGGYDTAFGLPSLNNGDIYHNVLYGCGVGNLGEHWSTDYPMPIEGIENIKQGAMFSPDWIDLEEYGGEYVGNGVFKFKLKHGETITIPNIPYGYSYEIIEKDYSEEGYEQKVDGVTGREASGELTEDKEHEFENRLQVVVPTKVTLYNNHIYIIVSLISIVSLSIIVKRKLKKREL